MKEKLLVICGPTATGKTTLAIKLAKEFNGEIVSADSRQVYTGMDIGTGKDLPVNSKLKTQSSKLNPKSKNLTIGFYEIGGVRVWLYDIVKPDYRFNVADYLNCSDSVIKDIWKRKKLPILTGGTGFYIKVVTEGLGTLGIKPDQELRERMSKLTAGQLREKLEKICPERLRGMNESDRNNPRRLIRAIEIMMQSQSSKFKAPVKDEARQGRQSSKLKIEDSLMIGLKAPFKELYQRIDERVEERVARGAENEIKNLLAKGYSFKNSVLGTTIGYKEWESRIIDPQSPVSAIKQSWKLAEHQYLKRQLTWFKTNLRIRWFDISEKNFEDKVVTLVKQWYDKKDETS